MDAAVALAGLALVHLLAVASPGPSFMLVAQAAVGSGRRAGLLAALATTVGAVAWATAALFGLQALFARFEWLHVAMQVGGALFLLWIAFQIWRHAHQPLPEPGPGTRDAGGWKGFVHALLLALSNPKIMVFFGSIFLSVLPADMPPWMPAAALAIVAANEFVWYALVTFVFSGGPARAFYRRAKLWLDRAMAGVLGLLGARLLFADR